MHGCAGCLWRSVRVTTTPTLPLWISTLLMTQSAPLRRWASVVSFRHTLHHHHVMHHMGLVNVLLPVLIVPLGQVATLFPDIYFCIIHGPDNLIC